jgi:hypothetical protein
MTSTHHPLRASTQTALLATALALSMLGTGAAQAQSLLVNPANTTTQIGQSFSLTIEGKDFATAIVGGGFNLSFDPTVLHLDSMTIPTSWEFFRSTGLLDEASGTVTDVSFNTFSSPKAGDFLAATLNFTAVRAGTSLVKLAPSTPYVFADVDVNQVNPSFGSATVNVSAVPEPASLSLVLAGAGLMAAMRRRRQG